MLVNLELYRVFYTVAKTKSMTKAANELAVSQPAVTKSIKTLESQLGGTLFIRSNKGLELTEEGKSFYNKIEPALILINDAENSFGDYKELKTGEIKIGISSVLTKILLVDIIKEFTNKYPNIKISITNGTTEDLVYQLNKGKLDFVIYNEGNVKERNIDKKLLTRLDYAFVYNNAFFDLKNIKDINELKDYPLILQKETSNTRKYFNSIVKEENINPFMEVLSQDLICDFVNSGLGIGFVLKDLAVRNYTNLSFINIDKDMSSNVYIGTNKSLNPTFAANTFLKMLNNKIGVL